MSADFRSRVRLAAALALAAGATVLSAAPAAAQYFGRNKVQYETFDFRILRTTNLDVYFYPEEELAARDAARMAERWYARLSQILEHEFESRQPLILYASHPHFQQTTALSGDIGEGTGGVTEAFKQRIILPMANSYEETDHVIGHELVHAFQFDISGFGRAGGGLEEAAQRYSVPLWFSEGMAEYLTRGPVHPHTAMFMRDAALTGRVPTLEQLTYDPSFFPYRWGGAFWAYVGGRWGDASIGQILKQVGQGVPYPDAFQRILNVPLEEIVDEWGTSIRRTYLPLLGERREPREIAQPLFLARTETNDDAPGGRYNLAPVLSPDGTRFAFLSSLSNQDVELFVGDAQTGRVIRRILRGTAFDPHFASLRYINSAGTWSPDGRRFAFSALKEGRDVVVLVDAVRGGTIREYGVPGVSEITNPTWSPDGTTMVFSGLRGGISDLYLLDLNSGRSRQLTDDRFADLQPMYSPDGRSVAFTTDRGTTDFETLRFGDMRLAVMDVASGEVRSLTTGEAASTGPGGVGKNINPQWTRDGRGLYFISDRDGIANVYRVEVATNAVTQVTNIFTGVSGITDLSPAISSSYGADKLLFTAFEGDAFNIYSITDPVRLAGTVPPTVQVAAAGLPGMPMAALLPPVPRAEEAPYNRVLLALNESQIGLPDPEVQTAWTVVPYRARISLDYLGQPAVGASVNTGAFSRGGLYGGITGIFSDVLGHHTIYGSVQAQGQIDEVGFSVLYLNAKNRWNWGVAAQRVPFVYGGYRQSFNEEGTEFLQQQVLLRYFDTSLSGILQYPLSQVQRVEVSGGVRRIASDRQIREAVYQPVYGIDEDGDTVLVDLEGPVDFRERTEEGNSFNLAEGSAALVYDASLMGYTSPFAGQRYRFEVAPTVGSLQFTTATADYRRYVYLRPFTLAFRGMHVGRYGRDEHLVGDIFLGWPFLIRGYGREDVAEQCEPTLPVGGTECDLYFDELRGTRVGVANLELRVPLIRQMVVGNTLGLPPIEGFAFFDAGSAWGKQQLQDGSVVTTEPTFRRGVEGALTERGIVTSAGVGARVNLFGYFILEGVYVKPFERERGWHWQFSMQPGF
ncbi:MAG TPA: BamA/TamA family outer membrane protein [Longimicrobium sp.]|nr:BamA/TamA family outer membrane protein [Longimicrobium sp.]